MRVRVFEGANGALKNPHSRISNFSLPLAAIKPPLLPLTRKGANRAGALAGTQLFAGIGMRADGF